MVYYTRTINTFDSLLSRADNGSARHGSWVNKICWPVTHVTHSHLMWMGHVGHGSVP